jgi:methionyl-tRNA formyltransferase
MRLIFAGTPEFAAVALRALIAAGHDIPLVLTQPDRPAGRGMQLKPSPVKEVALAHGLAVHQPHNLKSEEARQPIVDAAADVMVVAAYGLILPQAALDLPRLGCVNIHASLLPRWRGAAPIHRAIEAGDAQTGITLMQMEAGLDTGPMLMQSVLPILPDDTTGRLHDRLAEQGGRDIVALLPKLAAGEITPVRQDDALTTYAAKIGKAEARLDWSLPAEVLARRIRAFDPFPGAFASHAGEPLKIWQARAVAGSGQPGSLLAVGHDSFSVACGQGALAVSEVQKAGGKRLPVAAFLSGTALQAGDLLT